MLGSSIWPIKYSSKYGFIHPSSKHFSDLDYFSRKILYNKITKIKIWTGKSGVRKVVVGIEFTFKSLINGEEKSLKHQATNPAENVYEFVLGEDEYIRQFHITIDTEVTAIGFTTSKGNTFLEGGDDGYNKIVRLNEEDNCILGLIGCIQEDVISSCGVLYASRIDLFKCYFLEYFCIRYFIKNYEYYKAEIEKKEFSDDFNKAILRVCKLPNKQFYKVIQYCPLFRL